MSKGVVASSRIKGGPNEALVENRTVTLTVAAVVTSQDPLFAGALHFQSGLTHGFLEVFFCYH